MELERRIVMTTASQQINIPTWKEVIGNALLVEYELKFDVNFSQRKHILFYYISFPPSGSVCLCLERKSVSLMIKKKPYRAKVCTFSLWCLFHLIKWWCASFASVPSIRHHNFCFSLTRRTFISITSPPLLEFFLQWILCGIFSFVQLRDSYFSSSFSVLDKLCRRQIGEYNFYARLSCFGSRLLGLDPF